jgi:hypothetical protein
MAALGAPCEDSSKGFDFADNEIKKGTHPRRVLHIPVHKQIKMRHQLGYIIDNADKLVFSITEGNRQWRKGGPGFDS